MSLLGALPGGLQMYTNNYTKAVNQLCWQPLGL